MPALPSLNRPPVRRPAPARVAPRALRGFTLIELVIAIAIVAILVSVALPSYREYVRRSVRAEAQAYMMAVAARQQQFLVDTRAYAATLSAVGVTMPSNVSAAYTASLPTPGTAPPSLTLTLTPSGGQASDSCGTLSINHSGNKTAAKTGCW